ncbi:hypothetical protein ACPPVO_41620 [Dactylosporangium sp. McL0621]|uniref:hypothetical protein n=1 Tax=Dactylosporangium sp. McL0621 TaxID=3415678 RepID=UPI003CF69B54
MSRLLRQEQDGQDQAIAERRMKAAHADQAIAERRMEAAHAAPAGPRPADVTAEATASDGERLTGEWLEQLARLKLGHAGGTVSDSHDAAGLTAARAGLRDGTAVLVGSDAAAYVAAIAAAIMGDPIPGAAGEAADAGRAARLLEAIVRLKLRHEAGELDDDELRAAQAELGRAIQDEAERLG